MPTAPETATAAPDEASDSVQTGHRLPLLVAQPEPGPPGRHRRPALALGSAAIGSMALGALAIGALAIGALAIGRLRIGDVAVGRARLRRLEIDELVIRKVTRRD